MTLTRVLRAALGVAMMAASAVAVTADAQAPATPAKPRPALAPVTAEQVLDHLNQTIAWYRQLATIEQSSSLSDNELARDRLQRASVVALQFAFEFAHAAARLLDAAPQAASAAGSAPDSSDDTARLERAAAGIAARVATLQARIAGLDAQLAKAPPRAQPALSAQRAEAGAALNLSLEIQKTVLELQRFASSSTAHGVGGTNSLTAKVNEIQRAVPESRGTTSPATRTTTSSTASGPDSGTAPATAPTAAAATPTASPQSFRIQSGGLVALTSQWLALRGTRRQLDAALDQTDALSTELDTLRAVVSKQVRVLVRANMADTTAADPGQLIARQHQLEYAATTFKRLSTLMVPLGEQDVTVDDAHAALAEWRDVFGARSSAVLRNLLLHAIVLIASIVLVLVISEIWRRATFRYLHDARRRRQFLLLRRVVVAIALLTIIILGFVSEIGSLATYVGFLTAGLAVALQNVILAIVAYFFLIGRFGVRVGDRITLAGVTGRVIDIGLIRIYLMELAGPELQATGRIVVLSNAVLFQPAALFKQIPGAEYVWHTVTLTLAPATDVPSTQARLKAVADKMYASYRASIDEQHATVQRLVDFDTSKPEPHVDVHFTERALEFVVRYPVLPEQAAANDQTMIKALRDAVADEAAPVVEAQA